VHLRDEETLVGSRKWKAVNESQSGTAQRVYRALCRIFLRFRCNLLVRFFFHFQRILAVDFL